MHIISIRHDWPEVKGFSIDRPYGINNYTFVHFKTPVILNDGKKKIFVNAGGCIVYSPYTPQKWTSPDCELSHDWFHIPSASGELIGSFSIPFNKVFYPENSDQITELVADMEREFFCAEKFSEQLQEILISRFFICLSRGITDKSGLCTIQKDLLDGLKNIRHKAFMQPEIRVSVPEMAKELHLSESRFYTVYRQAFGISPNRDLILARIEKAKNYAESKHFSSKDTAKALGYKEECHFIRQFRAVTGMTPGEYHNQITKI